MSAAGGRLLGADVRRVHVVGIAGAGMSGVAAALLDLELTVSGSDLRATAATEQLRARGARIQRGHDALNVAGADLVVHSAAVPADNAELTEAKDSRRARGLACGDHRRALQTRPRGIAVAGTHGKSTTSAMIAAVLRAAGRDPSFLLGAASPSLDHANGRYRRGSWMVVEADEFDSAFSRLSTRDCRDYEPGARSPGLFWDRGAHGGGLRRVRGRASRRSPTYRPRRRGSPATGRGRRAHAGAMVRSRRSVGPAGVHRGRRRL